MSVRAKAGADGFQGITDWVLQRFRANLGATIERPGGKRIFLIPENILDERNSGIVIANESGGCYVYRGDKELNEFVLVSAGFSLQVGVEVSKIVNALVTQYGLIGKSDFRKAANKDLLKLTHDKENEHG